VEVTFFVGGTLNELFLCDIQDNEMPLGFEMHANAFGLNVSYETYDDQKKGFDSTNRSMRSSNTKSS
jgi:hypothetical protein